MKRCSPIRGFFAETELYEVKKAVENHNVLDTAYFVKPEDIEQYTEEERVFNDDGTLVMDYWCALWFWPIQKADMLPSRAEFLFDLSLVFEGNLYDSNVDDKGQQLLFPDTRPKQMSLTMLNELGHVDVDRLCAENKRLGLVKELANRYRYLHWELEFADLFESRGGFDLVLGNPPWIKVEWNESGVLGDAEPLFVLCKLSASALAEKRDEVIFRPCAGYQG